MSTENETPAVAPAAAGLTPAEQASVEVGQRGLTEPTAVNELPAATNGRPDYIPEKFWKDGKADLEGLATSYAELEKSRSAPAPVETPAETPAEAPVDAEGKIAKPEPKAEEAATAPLTTAMDAARTEWAEKQEVSEETIASLEAAGIPKEVFNLYIEGVKATQAATLNAIYDFAGGEDAYGQMATWAGNNLNDAELNAFNAALDDPNLRENAVRGLSARYTPANPSEGTLITPAGTPSQAGDVYTDRAQLLADQKNPQYQTDAAFRATVQDKLMRSQRGGFQMVARPTFERQVFSN